MLILKTLVLLLACAVVLGWLARHFNVAYPIVLVLGGIALGFVPKLPDFPLDPNLILVVVLPPILYDAALNTSLRDFRANIEPIAMLAVGLVLATTVAVAVTAKWLVPELPWAAAFVLGAIVSPPDAAAATAILGRLKLPRRVVAILEGESLVNDAAALVLYKFAVAAVLTGAFSLADASIQFVGVAVGGVAVGVAMGWLFVVIHTRLKDSLAEIMLSVLLPYSAYLIAEALHVSGVLAVVAAGLVRGRHAPELFEAETRLLGHSVWNLIVFLMNALIFILIGWQMQEILTRLAGYSALQLVWYSAAVSAVAIAVRMLWVFPGAYLPPLISWRRQAQQPPPPWQWVTLVGWCGMRGIVSLAAALALPLTTYDMTPFPGRDLIVFLTFVVIVVTLVVQGLTLTPLIRALKVGGDWDALAEERAAREALLDAALAEIARLEQDGSTPQEVIDHVRADYESRRAQTQMASLIVPSTEEPMRRTRLAAIDAERARLIDLWRADTIGDQVLHELERELDLEQTRLAP